MDYIESQVCFHLYVKTRAIIRLHDKHLKSLGLTYPRALVLLALESKRSSFVDEIGTCLSLDIGTLSPLLKKMEKEGMVSRKRDENDERKVLIRMTNTGEAKISEIKKALSKTASMICGIDIDKDKVLEMVRSIKINKI